MAGGDPYCSNCNYSLVGLTDSAKCPECGKPIVEVLQRRGGFLGGRRYTSNIVLFGLPLVQVALIPVRAEPARSSRSATSRADGSRSAVARWASSRVAA